jgi:DNA adenine methylase
MNTKILGRYRGGKEKLAEKIVALFPKNATTYVEPFGGGASVLLHTAGMFRQRVYNDINDDIVTMWRVIRDQPEELAALIWATPYSRAEMQSCYPPSDASTDLERARRMITLGNLSMAPTRCNPRSTFVTSPHGVPVWLNMPDTIINTARLFRDVVIESTSWESLLPRFDLSETVWYFDPPYVLGTRVGKKEYHTELTDLDHFKFLKMASTLYGSVFISGYDNDLYKSLIGTWNQVRWQTHTMGQGIGKTSAGKRTEVLWYRYSPSVLIQQSMGVL